MTVNDGLTGLAFLLVMEGILPFAAPSMWREAFRRMTEMNDGQLRFIGAASMLGGVFLLLFLH